MKKTLIYSAVLTVLLAATACSNGDKKEVIVSTNSGDITKEEFYQEMKEQVGAQILQTMVFTEILEDRYEISEEKLDKRVKEFKKRFKNEQQKQLMYQQLGIKSDEDLRELIRQNMLYQKAATEGIHISEKEMRKYYEKHITQFTKVKAQHILVEEKQLALKIKKRLENGGNFAELSKNLSKAPAADNGGKLGWIQPGEMVPEFEKAAFSLDKGEISDPVKTSYGYHIIKVNDKKVKPFNEVKDQIKQTLLSQKAKSPQEVYAELRKEADIEVKDEDFKDLFKPKKDQN